MISLTFWKIPFINFLMTLPSASSSLFPLQTLTKSQACPTLGKCLSILTNLSLFISPSPKGLYDKPHPPSLYFLNNALEEVQLLKLLDLNISHDFSWANPISKLVFKASCRLDILHYTKSFLDIPKLLCLQGIHLQLDGVLLSPLGWCSCLILCQA